MKLLFDNNLSVKLSYVMDEFFPGSTHVHHLKIAYYTDYEIWEYAKKNDFTIVTKDKDFYYLSTAKGHPPKVIWIIAGNCRNEDMIKILLEATPDIQKFLKNQKDMLVLR